MLGNVHVLEACRKARVKRYLYASTVYVYSPKVDSIVVVNNQLVGRISATLWS